MNEELFDRDGNMSDDSYLCFMRALRENVGRGKRSQVWLAGEIGVTPGHMNRIFHERGGLRAPYNLQLKIVEALGYKHRDFLDMGRRLLNGGEEHESDDKQQEVAWPNDYLSFIDILAETRDLQVQLADFAGDFSKVCASVQDNYRKVDTRMEFWRGIVNHLPLALCIIKDGVVVWQNRKSLKWGKATGEPLCLNCIDQSCRENDGTCAIKTAILTGNEETEVKTIDGNRYQVSVYPLVSEAAEYAIVAAAQIEELE